MTIPMTVTTGVTTEKTVLDLALENPAATRVIRS